jgi:hypothetical protein
VCLYLFLFSFTFSAAAAPSRAAHSSTYVLQTASLVTVGRCWPSPRGNARVGFLDPFRAAIARRAAKISSAVGCTLDSAGQSEARVLGQRRPNLAESPLSPDRPTDRPPEVPRWAAHDDAPGVRRLTACARRGTLCVRRVQSVQALRVCRRQPAWRSCTCCAPAMKPRRAAGGERADSTVLLAALVGIIIGSSASLWTQRGAAAPVCSACAPCALCVTGGGAAGAGSSALATTELLPVGGTWRPAGRESAGNAELQKVLQRIAINDEVLVAGAPAARTACRRTPGLKRVRNDVAQSPTPRSSRPTASTAC